MKIMVYTACHGRIPSFSRFCDNMRYNIELADPDIDVTCIGPPENFKTFSEASFENYILYSKNLPLGEKWNVGLNILKDFDFDYLFISGSDDLYSPALFDYYSTIASKESLHYIGALDFYFFNGTLLKYFPGHSKDRAGEPNGAGRMIHRNVLETVGWRLWEDKKNSNLDGSMTNRLKFLDMNFRFIKLRDYGLVAIDLKDGENIHDFETYKGELVNDVKRRTDILNAVGL